MYPYYVKINYLEYKVKGILIETQAAKEVRGGIVSVEATASKSHNSILTGNELQDKRAHFQQLKPRVLKNRARDKRGNHECNHMLHREKIEFPIEIATGRCLYQG